MAEERVQNYANHVQNPKQTFTILGIYLLALILAVAGLIMGKLLVVTLAVLVTVVGSVLAVVVARTYATKLQDRIIRLEMRLRLREVLPADLAADIMDFTLPQLIGMRFASDDELPELARKVLDEDIVKAGDIKKLIRDWQADWHRV